jgi:biotin-dependent carboxylase-like uncharacterized protein
VTVHLKVIDGGPLTTIQDAGRPGQAHLGVAPSGFLDAPAATLANRLVGNPESTALLETTGRGPRLRLVQPTSSDSVVVALTGAPASIRINGRAAEPLAAQVLHPDDELEIGTVTAGVRSYLAIRGGLLVPEVLGSRSTDLLSGLGPAPLQPGQLLAIGTSTRPVPPADVVAVPDIRPLVVVSLYLGPSDQRFQPDSLHQLTSAKWTVSSTSSRVGLRLIGPGLQRLDDAELPPEGMVRGAVQVPPDGQPVVLLADGPVTGGYPVIGVVRESDHPLLAQAAPGTELRFQLAEFGRRQPTFRA